MQDRRRHRRRHAATSSATRTPTTATRTATSSTGPEFLTVFDGATGKALATVDYLPPRGRVADWGDDYGNRVDRFLACVAYLDGERPERRVLPRLLHAARCSSPGTGATASSRARWTFDSDDRQPRLRGQGDHSLSVADVDGDGKDDIIYGACCIGSDGKGLYSTGLGHGDALHVSDLDPSARAGGVQHPRASKPDAGVSFRDARTGKVIWSKPSPDVGRGLAADIDPRHRGYEFWASGPGLTRRVEREGREGVATASRGQCNFAIWWDGDLLRELLDRTTIIEMGLGERRPRRRC